MSDPVLKRGQKGTKVKELQTLLEQKLKPQDRRYLGANGHLEATGVFDEDTDECVQDFQLSTYLKRDGVVGHCTWLALRGEEAYNAYQIPARVISNNAYHCWAACLGMLKNSGALEKTKVANVVYEQLAGNQIGGLENSNANTKIFAAGLGLEFKVSSSWICFELCESVKRYGRHMINIRGVTPNLTKSVNPNDSHWVLLGGLRGDGTPKGTTLYLMNPSTSGADYEIVHTFHYLRSLYNQLTYQAIYKLTNSPSPIY